jgi:hypothetical protein
VQRLSFQAFPGFNGGVRVAMGDINGDGTPDIIVAAGRGAGPHVRIFDSTTGQQIGGPLGSFYAYHPNFSGGVFVASGDIDGDGRADLITAAGAGGGPHVRVFSGATGAEIRGFYAYAPDFSGGVSVAVGDVDGNGRADIITGAGAGAGPHVRVFSGNNNAELRSFYAYSPFFPGGVFVGAGDVNADGRADIITGAGAGGGPHVRVFSGQNLVELTGYYAYDPLFSGGVRVAGFDLDGDGRADVVTSPGSGMQSQVRILSGANSSQLNSFLAYSPQVASGVFVAGQRSTVALLQASSSPSSSGASSSLTDDQLSLIRAAAIDRWHAAGISDAQADLLSRANFGIVDLKGDVLGMAFDNTILLDLDGAGHGWFVDATPLQDEEFSTGVSAAGDSSVHMDLLTVVSHELGHLLGLHDLHSDSDPLDVMSDRLSAGVRRTASSHAIDLLMGQY